MNQRKILVVYGSRYGQSEKIATRIGDGLHRRGHAVKLSNVGDAPAEFGADECDACLVVAPVYLGRHLKAVERWVRGKGVRLLGRPSAFVSVCGAAIGSSEADREEAARYVADFRKQTGWTPDQTAIVAGAVRFTKYGLLTRWILRMIQKKKGLDTDPSRDYEYTDWGAVEDFAAAFADLVERSGRDVSRAPTDAAVT